MLDHVSMRRLLLTILAAVFSASDCSGADLAALGERVPRIVFVKNHTIYPSFYAYTEGQSDAQRERHFTPGSALCLLKWDGNEYG